MGALLIYLLFETRTAENILYKELTEALNWQTMHIMQDNGPIFRPFKTFSILPSIPADKHQNHIKLFTAEI